MKKLLTILLAVLTGNLLWAQTDKYKTAIEKFKADYNAEKYNEIFNNSFSAEMQAALPLDKTIEFLTGLNAQIGKIETSEFKKLREDNYASFKTKFEKAVIEINISLDESNKINGLFFKPYEESDFKESNTINASYSYPKPIADLIFEKAKNLPNKTQLSIAIIQNGATNYYGIINENDSIKPIENQNSVFEIGSITKVFTSTVLAYYVENGKLKLSDNINKYYDFPFKNNIQISFQSLANQTSGLPRLPQNLELSNIKNPYKSYGSTQIEDYLKNYLTIDSANIKNSEYSNLGVGLLGYTIGKSQKTSFQKLIQKTVFDNYGMSNSYTSSTKLGENLVKGLDEKGNETSNWDFDALFAAGGIISSTSDLAKFAAAHFDQKNKVLALTRKPTFENENNMKTGLGWMILPPKNGKEYIWHNGGTGGYSSSMAIGTQDKIAVIILSNVTPSVNNLDDLCFKLIEEIAK